MFLIPATADLVRAEIHDRNRLTQLLGAAIPDNWPPETLIDALPWFLEQLEMPGAQGIWFTWYGILCTGKVGPVLAASAGFKGPPQNSQAEVGYSVLPQFQRQGLATEMTGALVDWALAQPDVERVIAQVHPDNAASLRVLDKLGFAAGGVATEPDTICFQRIRPASQP